MKKETKLISISVAVLVAVFAVAAMFYNKKKSSEQEQKTESNASYLIREFNPSIGPENAKVTMVEFLDPECEACRAMHSIVH